jgi:hypothetical protein
VDTFDSRLHNATLTAASPDATVSITAHGDGRLEVEVDDRRLRHHTETSLAGQIDVAIARLLRANIRYYLRAWRATGDGAVQPPQPPADLGAGEAAGELWPADPGADPGRG